MTVIIENDQRVAAYNEEMEALIKSAAKQCIEAEGIKMDVEVGVLLVDDSEIRKINKKERKIDRPTDVLSFPMIDVGTDGLSPSTGDFDLDCDTLLLGDIVISMETVLRQAAEYGHSMERELAFLVTHGLFHLLGYDHETGIDEKKMIGKQEQILTTLGLIRE